MHLRNVFKIEYSISFVLAEDEPEPASKEDVLFNAKLTEEGYFVAPPGNIPLKQDPKRYLKTID